MNTENKQTILIVEDQPEAVEVIQSVFREDFIVKIAIGGQSALNAVIIEPRPDLILLDIMMPGMDGYEVCRRLKADPITAFIPIVFLTGKDHIMDEAKAFMLGCVDFIMKPIDPIILEMRVRAHLRHHAWWLQREASLIAHIERLENSMEIEGGSDFIDSWLNKREKQRQTRLEDT